VRTIWFGSDESADIYADDVRPGPDGTRFGLVMPNGRVELLLRLVGSHNVQNAVAAAAAALSLGVSELTIASALEDARPVPGRLELVEAPFGRGGGVRTFVDYAHTPDALDKVCGTLADICEGRLHVVFGCGGDRDSRKRPIMAGAVARHADIAYLTSDNPRSEDPEAILADMQAGMDDGGCERVDIVDRAEAIRTAVGRAEPGDTVLIAGKGHETYQVLKDSVIPFDDRLEAARALSAREAGWLPQ